MFIRNKQKLDNDEDELIRKKPIYCPNPLVKFNLINFTFSAMHKLVNIIYKDINAHAVKG